MSETQHTETSQEPRPLTTEELDELAFMDAVITAGWLAAKEAAQSEDNYGGALLHRDIPFGD